MINRKQNWSHLVDDVVDPLGGVEGELQHPHLGARPGDRVSTRARMKPRARARYLGLRVTATSRTLAVMYWS